MTCEVYIISNKDDLGQVVDAQATWDSLNKGVSAASVSTTGHWTQPPPKVCNVSYWPEAEETRVEGCLRLVRALAVEMHENWLEAMRYLNMDHLREHKKPMLRQAA